MVDRSETHPGSVQFSLHRAYAVLLGMATMLLIWLFVGRSGELAAHQMLIPSSPSIEGWLMHQLFHASGFHLTMNLLVILLAGGVLESYWGTQRFLFFSLSIAVMVSTSSFVAGLIAEATVPGSDIKADITTRTYGASGLAFAYLAWIAVAFPSAYVFRSVTVRQITWSVIFLGAAGLAYIEVATRSGDSSSLRGTLLLPHCSGLAFSMLFLWSEPRVRAFHHHRQEQRVLREQERVIDMRLQVDELLDKINDEGYDSLTGREKNFLRSASKHYKSSR